MMDKWPAAGRFLFWLLAGLLFGTLVSSLAGAVPASRATETCLSSGERAEGQNKICYYSCPSGPAAITIRSYQLCPLTIRR